MSVPTYRRTEGQLGVFLKARDLAIYTLGIVTNEKTFDPKFYQVMTTDYVALSKSIFYKIRRANFIRVTTPEKCAERLRLQEEAILDCSNLLDAISLGRKLYHLPTKRVTYWGRKVVDTQNLIKAWRKSDYDRYYDKIKKEAG